MDALILAAGYGSRLGEVAPSKPLARVAGMPLIEIALHRLASAGADRVFVVTGHRADQIEGLFPRISARIGIAVEACRIGDWARPNGFSVMAGAERIAGDYLLVMADHLFAQGILEGLAGQGADDRGVTLAIDRRIDGPLVDPADATWVQTGGTDRIAAIGKQLADYDAVDCGAFLATPQLAQAIARAIADGKPGSLSDGMQVLASAGRAAAMDIGEAWWLDVDNPVDLAVACSEAPGMLSDIFDAYTLPAMGGSR